MLNSVSCDVECCNITFNTLNVVERFWTKIETSSIPFNTFVQHCSTCCRMLNRVSSTLETHFRWTSVAQNAYSMETQLRKGTNRLSSKLLANNWLKLTGMDASGSWTLPCLHRHTHTVSWLVKWQTHSAPVLLSFLTILSPAAFTPRTPQAPYSQRKNV